MFPPLKSVHILQNPILGEVGALQTLQTTHDSILQVHSPRVQMSQTPMVVEGGRGEGPQTQHASEHLKALLKQAAGPTPRVPDSACLQSSHVLLIELV